MTKIVIRNYILAFKWQNIKEKYSRGGWFLPLYMMIIIPWTTNNNYGEGLMFFLFSLPITLGMVSAVLFPIEMPKIIYLCPMNRKMRKEYLLKMRIIRTIVPIVMTMGISIIPLLMGMTNAIVTIGIILNNIIFSIFIGSGSNINGYGEITENGERNMLVGSVFNLLEFICFLCAVMMCVICASCEQSEPLWLMPLIIGIDLLILIPSTVSYLRYWSGAVENALSYETRLNKPTIKKK